MANLIAVVIGIVSALMIQVNGDLAHAYGNYQATVAIHVVGIVLTLIVIIVKREWIRQKATWYWYMGGAIGVFIVMSNNISFAGLGVSLTVAFGLLGQTIASLLIDTFGWFGAQKTPFKKKKLVGLSLIAMGSVAMMFS